MVKPEDIEVPEAMARAVIHSWGSYPGQIRQILRYALAWLANNPIKPGDLRYRRMEHEVLTPEEINSGTRLAPMGAIVEWQKRMFLKSPMPQELKLILSNVHKDASIASEDVETLVCEAYNAGIESAKRDEQLKRKLMDQAMAKYAVPPNPLSINYKGITIQQDGD